jgi:hypothetical protein
MQDPLALLSRLLQTALNLTIDLARDNHLPRLLSAFGQFPPADRRALLAKLESEVHARQRSMELGDGQIGRPHPLASLYVRIYENDRPVPGVTRDTMLRSTIQSTALMTGFPEKTRADVEDGLLTQLSGLARTDAQALALPTECWRSPRLVERAGPRSESDPRARRHPGRRGRCARHSAQYRDRDRRSARQGATSSAWSPCSVHAAGSSHRCIIGDAEAASSAWQPLVALCARPNPSPILRARTSGRVGVRYLQARRATSVGVGSRARCRRGRGRLEPETIDTGAAWLRTRTYRPG